MKRITQILASIVFVITVVTVYLAFDFAINNAISSKDKPNKHFHPDHEHNHNHDNDHDHHGAGHPHNDSKTNKKRSLIASRLVQAKRTNRTVKHPNEQHRHSILNNERQARTSKTKAALSPLRAKPGNFHKSKTGVKINKPQKSNKDQRRLVKITTTTAMIDLRNEHQFPKKRRH